MFPIIYAVSVETFEEPLFVAQEYPGVFESVDPNENKILIVACLFQTENNIGQIILQAEDGGT